MSYRDTGYSVSELGIEPDEYVNEYVPPPGWGEFGWKYIPKSERVCRRCHQPIKKMEDVFEVRRVFPSSKTQLLCHACRSQAPIPDQRP